MPVSVEEVETVTWIYADQGRKATALMIADANAAFQVASIAMANFLTRFDVVLSPTLAKPPAKLGVLGLSPPDLAAYSKEAISYSPFVAVANMTGQPSMSVPLHWTADGLPVGTLFTARYGDEASVYELRPLIIRCVDTDFDFLVASRPGYLSSREIYGWSIICGYSGGDSDSSA
jgi:amidase